MPDVRSLVAILGPTATGKSALGIAIAERCNGEIINCDSTAVYRGFDIGTDKVPFEQRRGIPHHLIDIVGPTDEYTAAQYARDAAAAIADIHARGKLPILVFNFKREGNIERAIAGHPIGTLIKESF